MEGQELGISFCLVLIAENRDTEVAVETTTFLFFIFYFYRFMMIAQAYCSMMRHYGVSHCRYALMFIVIRIHRNRIPVLC